MRTIEIAELIITERQRKERKDSKNLVELKKSIVSKGLMHSPLVSYNAIDSSYTLIAGERRVLSMAELHQDGIPFYHDQEVVPKGMMPYSLIGELDDADLAEAELEENILHAALSWQEEAQAKVKIHNLRKRDNPEQAHVTTAQEILVKSGKEVTPTAIRTERKRLVMMEALVPHINEPIIKNAKDITTAYNKHLEQKKKVLERELIKLNPQPTPHVLIKGDCREVMKNMQASQFDIILSDPPYGINAHQARNAFLHDYDDTPEYALALYRDILRQGFHLLKPQGSVFLFCDIEHFHKIRLIAEQQAYATFKTPFIWDKGDEGYSPWGRDGWKRTYECLLYCVKGQRSLALHPGSDVRKFERPTRNPDKVHAAEKPLTLLRYILDISARKGDRILDPCIGSAPIFQAAQGLNIHITGIELNEEYYNLASDRLQNPGAAPDSIVTHEHVYEDTEDQLALLADL